MTYCSFSGCVSASERSQPEFQEVVKDFEPFINKNCDEKYRLKVAQFELHEAFELLLRSIL